MLLPSILYGAERKRSSNDTFLIKTPLNDTYLIQAAFQSGFSGIDSAAMTEAYAEKDAGDAIKESNLKRKEIWVQSKFTPSSYKVEGAFTIKNVNQLIYNLTAPIHAQVRESLNWSLNTLQIQYIDSYLLHMPSENIYGNITRKDILIWKEFEALRNEGLIRQLGVADITVDWVVELSRHAKIKPAIVQDFGLNPITIEYCLENAIAYQAVQLMRNSDFLNHLDISNVASVHNVTNGQIVLKFVQLLGVNPVLGTAQEKHMQEALSLNFELMDEEVYLISQLLPDQDLFFSIYRRLQNGELLTQKNIVETIINSDPTELDSNLEKVLRYIPKIDPSTLSYILRGVGIDTVSYLKDHGARLDLLNKVEQEEILGRHSETIQKELANVFLNEFEEQSAEQLTLEIVLNEENKATFENIIQDLKNNILSEYWIEEFRVHPMPTIYEVILKHPEIALDLSRIGINNANILEALSIIEDQSYFDNFANSIKNIDIKNNIPFILANKCKLDVKDFLRDKGMRAEICEMDDKSWSQQKAEINNFAACCQDESNLAQILECYGNHNNNLDEL
jgi:diketogulonate reductase-like aldo/keto reductase